MFQADQSPALGTFGFPPEVGRANRREDYRWEPDEKLGGFGRAAIRGQPLDYAESVALGFANYFTPGARGAPGGKRLGHPNPGRDDPGAPGNPEPSRTWRRITRRRATCAATPPRSTVTGELARLEGLPTAALTLLALAGLVAGRRLRYEESLFLGLALASCSAPSRCSTTTPATPRPPTDSWLRRPRWAWRRLRRGLGHEAPALPLRVLRDHHRRRLRRRRVVARPTCCPRATSSCRSPRVPKTPGAVGELPVCSPGCWTFTKNVSSSGVKYGPRASRQSDGAVGEAEGDALVRARVGTMKIALFAW